MSGYASLASDGNKVIWPERQSPSVAPRRASHGYSAWSTLSVGLPALVRPSRLSDLYRSANVVTSRKRKKHVGAERGALMGMRMGLLLVVVVAAAAERGRLFPVRRESNRCNPICCWLKRIQMMPLLGQTVHRLSHCTGRSHRSTDNCFFSRSLYFRFARTTRVSAKTIRNCLCSHTTMAYAVPNIL